MDHPQFLPEVHPPAGGQLIQAMAGRQSMRDFRGDRLDPATIACLLWAAQGTIDDEGHRTAPSAGALYPLEVFTVQAEGVSSYQPASHSLHCRLTRDMRAALSRAALGQACIREAPLTIVLAAVIARTAAKYGWERGGRYAFIEVGHAAQNILLMATALNLGAVPLGAFRDEQVRSLLELPDDHSVLYLIPVGAVR
jgi:SagB-type dehydrogenase family enzyme